MKNFFNYPLLLLIFASHAYAFNPVQQAMEDMADPEAASYHRSSIFEDFFIYLVLIGLGLAFLFSNLKTKLNVFQGALLCLFPLIVMYVLKEALPEDWKFFAIPILLIYMFKIDSIGSYVFSKEKEVPEDKISPKKMNLYIDESEAQSRLNKDINTINMLYKAPNDENLENDVKEMFEKKIKDLYEQDFEVQQLAFNKLNASVKKTMDYLKKNSKEKNRIYLKEQYQSSSNQLDKLLVKLKKSNFVDDELLSDLHSTAILEYYYTCLQMENKISIEAASIMGAITAQAE